MDTMHYESIAQKLYKQYADRLESDIIRALSKLGYNFDSFDVRNAFAQNRLTWVSKDGKNWIYLDTTILVHNWKQPSINVGFV